MSTMRRIFLLLVFLGVSGSCFLTSASSANQSRFLRNSATAQPQTAACNGGASLFGWYGFMVGGEAQSGGGGKYLSGAILFDGKCGFTGSNISGGINSTYVTTTGSGSYTQNSDGTYSFTLNLAGNPSPQTYMIALSESGNKARGIETDGTARADIEIVSQLTTVTGGYSNASLVGTYASYCYGPTYGVDTNYVTFDGNGNLYGVDPYDDGNVGNSPYTGTYSVNSDGTFTANFADSYHVFVLTGVIDLGVTQFQNTYNLTGSGGTVSCTGRQFTATNLSGWYGVVVGGGGKNLAGSMYFDGNGNLSGNVTGGQYGGEINSSVTGSYVVNSDNTLTLTWNLSTSSTPQTYIVGIGEAGNDAVGIEMDGSATATITIQSQVRTPSMTYTAATLQGAYSVDCYGNAVDFHYISFDGVGNVAGIEAYNEGSSAGSGSFSGTYTVNADGTFSAATQDSQTQYVIYGVVENGNAQIGYTLKDPNSGAVTACLGEATYEPSGTGPVSATPGMNPAPGAYGTSQSVTLSDPTPGTVIYYTTNGTIPTTGSPIYSNPIPVNATTTVQAISVEPGAKSSTIAAGTYFLTSGQPSAATPTFSPTPGPYSAPVSVTLLDSTPGAVIYYTTDGTTPSTNSSIYSSQIAVNATSTIQAIAVASGYGNSLNASGTYTITLVAAATPTFSPAPGPYSSAQTVTLSDATSGATIHCTTDGSNPSAASPVCASLNVSATTTIQAIAVANGYNPSAVGSGIYTLPQSQTITFPAIPNQTYPAGPLTLNATSSSGLPVSYSISSGPATVSGNTLTVTGAGSITVQANQAGNTQYEAAGAVSQTFLVSQASVAVSLGSSTNPSALGQTVTFTATLTPQFGGQTSGTVSFTDGSTVLAIVTVSGNTAVLSTSTLAGGSHTIGAYYNGDSNFLAGHSSALSQVVTKAMSTATIGSSINPSGAGKPVVFTVTVTSSAVTPTGSVKLYNGNAVLATLTLSSGAAHYTTSKLPSGANSLTAVYAGDANNSGSSSAAFIQSVAAATTTTLSSSANPSAYGQTVVFTATIASVIGAPPDGETVNFQQGTVVLGTGTLSGGTASFSTSTLSIGSKPVKAIYGGDPNFSTSSSAVVTQVVGKAASTTTIGSSLNPATFGQSVTLTASVTSQFGTAVTGTLTFKDGTKTLGSAVLSGGAASYTTTKLARGTHSITAVYVGCPTVSGSTSSVLTQTVN